MGLQIENNRLFIGVEPEQIITGTPDNQIGLLGRIFIDLGIAVAAIGGAAFTGGASLTLLGAEVAVPAVIGITASAVGLVTNTTIDVAEGNTDALTLGLDIGLPFATEALGGLLSAAVKGIPLSSELLSGIAKRNNLLFDAGDISGNNLRNVNDLLKYNKSYATSLAGGNVKGVGKLTADKIVTDASKSLEKSVAALEGSLKSLTDLFDKVTGATKELIAKMLPRITKLLKQMKSWMNNFRKVISVALNPINFAKTKVATAAKSVLKNIEASGFNVKERLMQIKQRYNIEKQSKLQNALISKYNISKVDSSWILGTSLVINKQSDDGTIENAHLIWWFIPERTAHQGQRGAVPEPYGKRPVGMLNINQGDYDYIMAEASKGRYYLDNVANDKSDTKLFGGGKGINVSDLKSNFISRLFKNALSIIPGFSLFADVKMSIGTFKTVIDRVVTGELGTDYVKQLSNYKSHIHKFGGALLPKEFNSAANMLYKNQQFDGGDMLKSASDKVTHKVSNMTKNGTVRHVKNY